MKLCWPEHTPKRKAPPAIPTRHPSGPRNPNKPIPSIQPPNKGQMMEERLAAHIPMGMFIINTEDRRSEDHPQKHRLAESSPLLAHRPDPAHVLPRRPLAQSRSHLDHPHRWLPHHADPHPHHDLEIYGHEFWGADGKTIWYDLQTPRGEDFWLAGYKVDTGERTWYHLQRNEWSIHFNVTERRHALLRRWRRPRPGRARQRRRMDLSLPPETRRRISAATKAEINPRRPPIRKTRQHVEAPIQTRAQRQLHAPIPNGSSSAPTCSAPPTSSPSKYGKTGPRPVLFHLRNRQSPKNWRAPGKPLTNPHLEVPDAQWGRFPDLPSVALL